MKKWILTGLGAATALLWGTVFVVFLSQDPLQKAEKHSPENFSSALEKNIDDKQMAFHFESGGKVESIDDGEVRTVIGSNGLTEQGGKM